MSLSKLAEPCAELGMNIDGAAKFDLANVLWDQGEMTASIRMLQQLKGQNDLHKQAISLSRAELLVTLVSPMSFQQRLKGTPKDFPSKMLISSLGSPRC